jgi:hypothetical protein
VAGLIIPHHRVLIRIRQETKGIGIEPDEQEKILQKIHEHTRSEQ